MKGFTVAPVCWWIWASPTSSTWIDLDLNPSMLGSRSQLSSSANSAERRIFGGQNYWFTSFEVTQVNRGWLHAFALIRTLPLQQVTDFRLCDKFQTTFRIFGSINGPDIQISRLDFCCDFDWIFKVEIWNMTYRYQKWSDCHETKSKHI